MSWRPKKGQLGSNLPGAACCWASARVCPHALARRPKLSDKEMARCPILPWESEPPAPPPSVRLAGTLTCARRRPSRATAKDEGESEACTERLPRPQSGPFHILPIRCPPSPQCQPPSLTLSAPCVNGSTKLFLFLQNMPLFLAGMGASTTSRSAALCAGGRSPLSGPVIAMQLLHGCSSS